MFAALYLTSYLAYGAPALIVGQPVGGLGLLNTAIDYCLVVGAVAIAAFIARLRCPAGSHELFCFRTMLLS